LNTTTIITITTTITTNTSFSNVKPLAGGTSVHPPFNAGKLSFCNDVRLTATPITWTELLMSVHYIK